MHIGVAGLGKMGAAIAARLLDNGHQVTVWNRTPGKTQALSDAGAGFAATAAELAGTVEAVLTILTDGRAIDAVYHGPTGLLSGNVKGKLFIEMSTVLPEVEIELAGKVRAQGAALVECPVGGSVPPARQGKLIGLMGAAPNDAERARPILNSLCRRLEHCGPVGAGSTMKLAINLPLMVAWQAYGEAFAICRDLGWEPKRLLDLFMDTSGANNALKNRSDMIIAAIEGRDPGPTTFTIADGCKDLQTMLNAGRAKGVEMPAAAVTLKVFEEAKANGLADDDGSRISVYWGTRR
jgi:3-hydroxyisobutyrate dehydrogenase